MVIHRPMVHYLRDGRAPIPTSEMTSRVMSANRGKDTGPEICLRKALWNRSARGYRLHPKGLPGRPDIVYPKQRVAIMVNGCFWHRCPKCELTVPKKNMDFWNGKFRRNVERDQRVQNELEALGWTTIVVWECEIKENMDDVVQKICGALGKRYDRHEM
jgi:DNA mismatch endonuclease, patch repair protein